MFQHPVPGPVTRGFGPRPSFGFHNGFDHGWLLADPVTSRRVYSPADGVVTAVKWHAMVGWYVTILVPIGTLRLCHFAAGTIAVKVGQTVSQGRTFLGVMGSTGLQASGVHLHTDLIVKGERIDPAPYFTIPFRDFDFSGGEESPFPINEYEEDDDMRYSIGHRKEGSDEWMLVREDLRGDTPLEVGYIITHDEVTAKTWCWMYKNGWTAQLVGPGGRYDFDLNRDDYVAAQASARAIALKTVRSGDSTVDPQAIANAVNASLAGNFAAIPTAEETAQATRDAIIKPA